MQIHEFMQGSELACNFQIEQQIYIKLCSERFDPISTMQLLYLGILYQSVPHLTCLT